MVMTDKHPLTETELDTLFAAARDQAPLPSADLVARVFADAEAESAAALSTAPGGVPKRAPAGATAGWGATLLAALGGWPAIGGLATAAIAGVVIGVASPETIESWSAGYLSSALGYEMGDFVPAIGTLLDGG